MRKYLIITLLFLPALFSGCSGFEEAMLLNIKNANNEQCALQVIDFIKQI